MKKHLLALAAMTLTTFGAWAAMEGDIYSITPVSDTSKVLVAGDLVQFRIRLLARNLTDEAKSADAWNIIHNPLAGSKELDDVYNPLQIGIIVSGHLRPAQVISATKSAPVEGDGVTGYPYTDLLCQYQVQPGDIARPVYIALANSTDLNPQIPGDAGEMKDTSDPRYYLFNSDKWIVSDGANSCNFMFCGDSRGKGAASTPWGSEADLGNYVADYNLSSANFQIQSVEFDKNWDSKNYWREVKQGTTQTTYKPQIMTIGIGTPTQSDYFYVWSDNEDAVLLTGTGVDEVEITEEDGKKIKVHMATIKMVTGVSGVNGEYSFQLLGVTKGKTANLILSQTPGYRFKPSTGETVVKIDNYLSVPVYCAEPPAPNLQVCFDPANPTSAKSLTMDTSMKQVENLAEDAKPLYITLSEPFAEDVEIALTFTNVAKNECNPITNLNIAVEQYGDSFSTAEADRAFTNLTIKAGDTMAQVYLYPLGGTPDTQSQGISINAVIKTPSAKEHYEIGLRALLKVRSAHKPTITTPEAGTNYDAQEPTGFTVNVGVADCYRDLNLKGGFKVDVDYSDGGKMATTNVVFTENGEMPILLTGYGINVTYANIKVTEPDGTAYATVKIYFTVKPQKTVSAALYDSDAATEPHVGTSFKEGDTPIVRFTISEKKPAGEANNLYAFLVPQNEASSNCVDCAAFNEGVLIPGGQTESALSTYWKLNLADGTAATDGSKGLLSYKIVLRTANTLEDGLLEESYIDTDGLQFTVANVDTKVDGVMVNGDPDSVTKGQVYSQTVPAESDVPFIVSMTDPSVPDQTNGLVSVWIFTSGRSRISYNYSCVTSTTDTATMEHRFSDPGTTQTVQVVAIDKDLLKSLQVELKDEESLATFWTTYKKNVGADAAFSFKVAVDEAPMIILTPEELSFDENSKQDVLKNQKITVELNNPAPANLTVRLSLKPYTDENFGSLRFKAEGATYDPATGISTLDLDIKKDAVVPTKKPNVYVGGVELDAASLDGVAASMDDGWYLEAKVISGAVDEYSNGTGAIYIRNMPPVIRPVQGENITTNKQLSVGESYTFTWGVNDVMDDMTNLWLGTTKQGIKCDWYVNDGLQASLTTYVTNTTDQTTTIQINQEGLTTIKLVATDKDGEDYNGVAERIWYFYIAPTKKLAVTPVGPATDSKTKYFTKAKGLGVGRTWTPGNGLTLLAFQQTWNFNITSPDAEVRAYGYASAAAPYADDGHLGPGSRDVPISPTGDTATAAPYFTYDGVYDNYFYRWAFITPGENGGGSSISYGNLNPTKSPLAEASEAVTLDEYDEKKEAYQTKRVEAVFSREMFTGDNLGDINQDYIPDLYTMFYPNFGVANEEGEVTGDDLKDLSKFNDDGDYLPNTMDAPYASFIPQLSNTWVTAGRAFNARLEVRGYGNGLNNAPDLAGIKGTKPDRVYTDPQSDTNSTLAYVEYVSFTNYCDRAGLGDPADKTNWTKWSPERPTDPTLYDTDDDGMPDGYEYYIWYKAHVGELVVTKEERQEKDRKVMVTVTNLVRYTGRKYNIVDPVHPIIIPADEIEKIYDPITPNDLLAEIDTDLDGLPDLVEFEIGTNPFDYDTDHDLLPDGWEVAFSKTDPLNANNDNEKNEDGDFMAYTSMTFWRYGCEGSNEVDGVWQTVTNYVYSYGKIAPEGEPGSDYPHSIFTAFPYKPGKIENGKQKPDDFALGAMIVNRDSDSNLAQIGALNLIGDGEKVNLAVMHDQLLKYNLKPFDPRTGWGSGDHGGGVDTKAYQNYDEFMLLAFYLNTDEATLDDRSLDIADDPHFGSEKLLDMWARTTTHPLNADTNGDGVPDGWQLYVSWDHSVCGKDDPIIKQERKILKQVGPFGSGAPIFDIGTGDKIVDSDKDGLDLRQEFCGVNCCRVYEKCETIENVQPEWRNKAKPTDPWNRDTDGDGLTDGEEHVWLFGSEGADGGGLNPLSWDTDMDGLPDPWEIEFCGSYSSEHGENVTATVTTTNSVDTADGGTSNVVETTMATNRVLVAGSFNNDGMNPTRKDAFDDYDGDGLMNWQEYMVGTMRCWRYDDPTTPWAPGTDINGWGDAYKLLPDYELAALFSGEVGKGYEDLFRYFEGRWTVTKDMTMTEMDPSDFVYNRGFRSGHIDPGAYFSCCKHTWDPAFGRFYYFKDGVDHDLKDDFFMPGKDLSPPDNTAYNRWQAVIAQHVFEPPFVVARLGSPIYPTKYISCDPREADTDFDGMDDYYELFHGLNPLLGAVGRAVKGLPCDIVHMAYKGSVVPTITATSNYYLYWSDEASMWVMNTPMVNDGREGGQALRLKDAPGYSADMTKYLDFYQFPWLAGLPTADPDGDNIRNQQESILLKAQAAPTYQHTDPTPLWMTDSSFDYSLVTRFYQAMDSTDIKPIYYNPYDADKWDKDVYGEPVDPIKGGWFVHENKVYHLTTDFPWLKYDPVQRLISVDYHINQFEAPANLYSYEENEGYDSDHDYLSDYEESQGRTKPVSDPQQHDDPIRHQAMYFDGTDSRLQAPLESAFPLPDPAAAAEVRQDFLYFTVEAWAKVDQANIDDGALHTVIERAVVTGESGPADETFLRKNFLIGVKGGKWYGKFDSTGTDAGKAIEILDGPAATTAWTHLTLTYGPANGDELDDTQPMALRLYVHDTKGELVRKCEMNNLHLQPEHGESAIIINRAKKVGIEGTDPWALGITTVIGASVRQPLSTGTQPAGVDLMSGGYGDYSNYFKGYIDEVRVWDGAREETEIADDVLTRYTSALAQANRELVYEAWANGGLRTPMSPTALPPELRYHWAFDHLPSAVDAKDLLKAPAGFSTAAGVLDAKPIWVRPEGYVCNWWSDEINGVPTHSLVFTDYAWVPWINNTVSHLPCFDGSTLDSIYWSESFAGNQSVTNFASSFFAFPRTAEVWSKLTMSSVPKTWWNRTLDNKKTRFNLRNRVTVGADLLPLGHAFPKRISADEGGMWDDPSASDAWAETGADNDDNGLPDWWEKYAMKNYSPVLGRGETFGLLTTVNYHGALMSAKEAYLFDLSRGMLTDGKLHPEYADKRDSDGDYMPDWWEDLYGIQTNSPDDRDADPDQDGLSNYQEYRINANEPTLPLNPARWTSLALDYPDYFLKSTLDPTYYLGFKYTDHDFIENWLEGQTNGMESAIYDPHLDPLGTGWDNWSRARAQFNERTFIDVPVMNFADVANADTNVEESVTNEVEETSIRVFAGIRPQIQLTAYGSVGEGSMMVYDPTTSNYVETAAMMTLKAYQQGALVAEFAVEGETTGNRLVATIDGVGLKQGETVFVLENGYAVGFAKANVGFDLVKLVIDVKESSNVIPADAYSFAMGGITYIRRTEINGQKCKPRVVWAGVPADEYGTITEADILNHPNCAFDLDWKYLLADAKAMGIEQSDIQVVTYEAGDSAYGMFFGSGFQKIFVGLDGTMAGFERPQATLVGAMPDGGKVRTARPQFTFTGLELATAFAIEVSTTPSTNGVIYSAINLLPAKTPQGYVFTAPLDIGEELQDGSNYYWRVLGMNAKWSNLPVDEFTVTGDTTGTYKTNWIVKADAEWSKWDRFTTAVDSTEGTTGYGALKAKVRYFGDASATNIVLGVYESADFAGEPVANRTGVAFETEVKFDGLAAGEYYVMAFNDKNGNGKRDAWESWGYFNKVGSEFEKDALKPDYYTPVAVTVSAKKTALKTATVYMEDTDWGHFNEQGDFVMGADEIPDGLQGEPTVVDPEDLDLEWDGLTKSEEATWGTEPLMSDTDGDGFPDGYEVWVGMDPLNEDYTSSIKTLSDGTTYETSTPMAYSVNGENDVMAYAIVQKHVYAISNVLDGTFWTVTLPKNDPFKGQYKLGMTLPTTVTYPTVGLYRETDEFLEDWEGAEAGVIYALGGEVSVNANFVVVADYGMIDVQLMHFEVMEEFGFISGLATAGDVKNGLRPATALDGTVGKVGTRPFYGIDKYLVALLFGDPTETFKDAKGQTVQAMEWSFTSPVKFNQMDYNRRWGKDHTVLSPLTNDFDGDAIPDGWELYVAMDPSGSLILSPWKFMQDFKAKDVGFSVTGGIKPTKLEYNGWFYFSKEGKVVRVKDPEWTLADMFNNGVNPANPYDQNSLLPGTGIADKLARRFGIETPANQLADSDHDGLSNWAEYEGFKLYGEDFDVNDAMSLTNRLDYWAFLAATNTYAGAALTDHDFVEDDWEDAFQVLAPDGFYYASRYAADARADRDGDGWSNFAEARVGTDPRYGRKQSLSSVASEGDFTTTEYPIPVVKTTITYNGDVFNCPLVIKAWRGTQAKGDPDAVWNVASLSDEARVNVRFLGRNPNRPMSINLGPGSVAEGSVKLEAFDPYYTTYTDTYETNGTLKSSSVSTHGFDTSKWSDFAFFDQPFATDGENFVDVGNINYETGDILIPFDGETLQDNEFYWHVSGYAGMPGGTHVYETWDLANSYYRIKWRSRVVETGNTKTLYLSVSDEPSEANPCRGYLREGKNLFVVFADLNKDGSWSPDEPMGIVRDVDIGWSGTEISVELTDNKAPFERFVLPDSTEVVEAETNALTSGRVVITRTSIDGEPLDAPRKLIFTGDTAKRLWFGENDYLRRGEFDLDWRYLATDAERLGYTGSRSFHTVGYTLAYLDSPSNIVSEFTRTFDTTPIAPTITLGSEVTVLTARPVLTFKTTEGYTAFTLQIATDERFTNLVYEKTDFLPPAASESLGRTFSPEISVGNGLEDGMTYYWRVAQLNAKFRTNVWSQPARFTTAVASNEANTGYGALKATIGYFGSAADPATNVIVGAWASPDFTGDPAASVRLTNDCTIASFADQPVTVELDGLVPGDYYLLAFVDANGNGVRDLDEKWGYVNRFGTDAVGVFTPVAVTTASTKGATAIGAIVIEDNDLDLTATSGGVYVSGDADGDGLTDDSEEDEFGTDPYLWDTDGDGMPDGWEVWAGTDPLAADADYVEANDLMAYLEKTFTSVTVWDGTNLDSRVDYLLPKSEKVPFVGDAVSNLCFYVPYEYVAGESWGLGTNVTGVAGIVYATEETTVVLVHDQVYAETGYKWPEYTKPFTALDKYLLLRYLDSQGRADEDLVNQTRAWAGYTLKPGYPDNDNDGVMDGWELYVGADPWDFADRESDPDKDGLTLVQEYDRGNSPTDPNNLDTDNDGILDRYAYMYHLKGGDAGKDFDGDGLSNYAEYLITEVFKYAKCDPDNAKTDGACVDYFQKVGSLYLGEIFTDHDQIEDTWEDGFERSIPGSVNEFFASRDRYDPTQDADNDGWSNYAEYRAGTDPSATAALSIDGYTCAEFPVPTVEVNVSYNGSDLISGPLVIKAWNQKDDYEMVKAPDAVWTLGTTGTTTTQDGGYQSSDNTQGSALQQHEKFLGRKPHGTRTFYLTGGNVSEGSVKLLFIDKGYGLVSYDPVLDGFYAVGAGEPDNALWFYGIIDRGGKLVRLGSSIYKALGYEEAEVGTIDYKTGKITINFDHEELSGNMAADPGEGQSGSSNDQNKQDTNTEAGLYHWLDLDESYMRIEWKSSQALVSVAGVHYFSDPDPVSDTAKSHGHLREGLNSFVCFVDDDGDGEYTPGELFGFVRDVDVGWAGAKFSVELTETSTIFGRINLLTGANDRGYWYGIDSGSITDLTYTALSPFEVPGSSVVDSALSGGKLQHIRIDRYAVNGIPIGAATNQVLVPNRVVVDKWLNLDTRAYLHEGDILEPGIFDLDWGTFNEIANADPVKQRLKGGVDSVSYRIVIDNADFVHPAASNRMMNVAFTRWFDSKHIIPSGLEAMLVYGARPTFRWSMKDKNGVLHNSYTAFKLRILDAAGAVVYESQMTRAPFVDKDGNYAWEAPFSVGDQTPQGKLLARVGTFQWTVSMYNAKFQADNYAPPAIFATAVGQQQETSDHSFGSIKVAVKYTGPVEVLKDCGKLATTNGKVRVQAFTTPDFTGIPSAQTVITNLVALTNALDNSANVTLYGLPAGDYYVRAYIDSNGNFEKDDFESWGAAKSVATIAANTAAPVVGLYIEDADTDQDWIPDAWEWVKYRRLTHDYAKIDENGIVLKSATYSALTGENAGPNFSRFLTGASLTFFENAEASAKLIPDLASDTTKTAIEAIRDAIEKKVKPDTLRISSLVVDAANGRVLLTVDADVTDSIAGKLLTPIYELKAPTEVTVSIFKKSSLLVNEWTWVKDVPVTIDERLDQTIAVPVDVDFNSGFYKVEVIQ